jgi:hypothetical protein
MPFALIFDDASLILTLTIILLLSLTIYIGKGYQPLVHPLILSRQSDVSPIRYKGQSAIYRNASSPAGLELALKPRRKINSVLDVLQYGSDAVEGSLNNKRSFYGVKKSNQDVINDARAFAGGLAAISGVASSSELGVAVCVDVDSFQSFLVSVSGSLLQSSTQAFSPLVVPPAIVEDGQAPTRLPSAHSAEQIHAVFTTSSAIQSALKLSLLQKDTVFIVGTAEEAQSARALTSNEVLTFDQVIARSPSSASGSTSKSDVAEAAGDSILSIYWTESTGWVDVTNASLIAAVTAHLAFFSAHSQPNPNDHIYVATTGNAEANKGASSPHLSAAYHPAGLVLPLLALYTGASFSTSALTSTTSSKAFSDTKPTLLYTSPLGASTLATALCNVSARSILARPAARSKMAYLRSGTFSKGSFWDRLVFDRTRGSLLCQDLRSVLILGEGNSVSQELLDVLRTQLGCAVRQGYLPASALPLLGSELTAGIGLDSSSSSLQVAVVTAPLTAAHSLDLQAFSEEKRLAPAHLGAPNVAIEMKLVDTALAKSRGNTVEGASAEKDPSGEVSNRCWFHE